MGHHVVHGAVAAAAAATPRGAPATAAAARRRYGGGTVQSSSDIEKKIFWKKKKFFKNPKKSKKKQKKKILYFWKCDSFPVANTLSLTFKWCVLTVHNKLWCKKLQICFLYHLNDILALLHKQQVSRISLVGGSQAATFNGPHTIKWMSHMFQFHLKYHKCFFYCGELINLTRLDLC